MVELVCKKTKVVTILNVPGSCFVKISARTVFLRKVSGFSGQNARNSEGRTSRIVQGFCVLKSCDEKSLAIAVCDSGAARAITPL